MEAERCALLIFLPPSNSLSPSSQVSSSLAPRTQSMTKIPPTLIPTSLSLMYLSSGSALAYRCVHNSDSITSWTRINGTAQEIAWNLGGTVAKCDHREYGSARIQINKLGSNQSSVDALFEGLGDDMEVRVMSLYVDSRSSR